MTPPDMLADVWSRRSRIPQACRSGAHRYGAASVVAPGILRRICQACSAVSIDLTAEEVDLEPALFSNREES